MKYRWIKVAVCAIAMAFLISGAGYQAKAARGVLASLPAAGLGLTMDDGASVAQIREAVKQKKAAANGETTQQNTVQLNTAAGQIQNTAAQTITAATENDMFHAETGAQVQSETVSGNALTAADTLTEASEETAQDLTLETETAVFEIETQTAEETADSTVLNTAFPAEEEVTEDTVSEREIVWAVEPKVKEPKTQLTEEETQEPDLIIAQVNNYVNIRSIPSTDGEVVGKLYDNSVGTLIAEENGWYQIKSGSVEGYVKAEYFKVGAEAKQIADEVGNKIATVTTETLRVRTEPDLNASVLGLVPGGEQLTVLETAEGFVKVSIEEGDGWVSTDYVDVAVEYVTAESREEEEARLAAEEQAREEARKAAEAAETRLREQKEAAAREAQQKAEAEAAAAQQAEAEAAQSAEAVAASSNSLGTAVANFAVQFVGNPYVYGGTSLTNGADCSGFVMSVYKNFGVSLPHSSYADRFVGYKVNSMAEAQPGDIICYSGHVALYIGNGKIVHASTKKTGIKISDASYRTPLAIRRIF